MRILPLLVCSGLLACQADAEISSTIGACLIEVDGTFDSANDGIIDVSTAREFDSDGRPIREQVDTDGDGDVDRFSVYSYGDASDYVLFERFEVRTQKLLSSQEQSFDEEDRVILRTLDGNADGKIDETTVFSYTSEGRTIRTVSTPWFVPDGMETVEESTFGPHGITEFRSTKGADSRRIVYTYNDQGRVQSTDHYKSQEHTERFEHLYNDVGHKTQTLDTVYDDEGEHKHLQTYSHDARGFITGWVMDLDSDGSIDSSAVCSFDDEGRMLSEHMDDGNDGSIDYVFSTSFDEYGRVLHELDDGRRVTYHYDCE